jgi:predicted phosphodiesterase
VAPDAVVHGGDIVNGPLSAEVVALVRLEGWAGVMGNHEDYVLRYDTPHVPAMWKTERFAPVHWARSQLAGGSLEHVRSLPITFTPHPEVTIVHGSIAGFRQSLRARLTDEEVRRVYADIATPVIVCGHTHLPHVRVIDRRLYVNAGSSGITLDGDTRASYALLSCSRSGWQCDIKRVRYDVRETYEMARAAGWMETCGGVAATMMHEMTTGKSWTTPFIRWWEDKCPGRRSVDAYREFAGHRGVDPFL